MREVVRLVLHLPFDHHELAERVRRALDVYLDAVGTGPDVFSEYDLGYEPSWLHADAWERIRDELSPPVGPRFLEDVEDKQTVHFYVKNQFERTVELSGGDSGVSGYGFFYWARLPWRARAPVKDEVSMVSFSWPTEYLEAHGPGRLRELALELASLLPFSSGHAGLAFYSPSPFGSSLEGIHEEAFRYPGLDVAHGSLSLGSRVDGVHWLNFLGHPVLGELGGAAGLRSRLHSPGTTVQELEGERVVVTLGQWPEGGDLTQGRDLPAYRELARVLEPWLYPCPKSHDFKGASHEETLRWWRRFLD
ncbi:type VI immunity family protein [Archangium sp.]|uniref:type VI immunity family protein n=1 Tax=Archangium sp. TaxID=1872627 RepID=UPI002ED78096